MLFSLCLGRLEVAHFGASRRRAYSPKLSKPDAALTMCHQVTILTTMTKAAILALCLILAGCASSPPCLLAASTSQECRP